MGKRHDWLGPVLQVGAAILIVIAILSKRWFPLSEDGDTNANVKIVLVLLAIVTMAMAVVSMMVRSTAVAIVTTTTAFMTIVIATAYVFTAKTREPVGPAYPLLLVGLAMVMVGVGMTPANASSLGIDERGATRFGKREGRWEIYNNNTLVEIRDYENNVVIKSVAVTDPANPPELPPRTDPPAP